jgi:hypothetical protein
VGVELKQRNTQTYTSKKHIYSINNKAPPNKDLRCKREQKRKKKKIEKRKKSFTPEVDKTFNIMS